MKEERIRTALTIAGSDCSGGAGIQADLKTFGAHGIYGMSVIVSVVAENTSRVIDIQDIRPDIIEKQMDAIFEDIEVDAVKVGMLSGIECMQAVSCKLKQYKPSKVVIDPVMLAKGGHALMQENALYYFIKEVLPLADLLTPNIPEAEAITGMKISTVEDIELAAKSIYSMGAKNILLKGGHREGDPEDILFDGERFYSFKAKRVNTKNTHGTGCTLSSAITSNMAMGMKTEEAVKRAKAYVTMAIENSLEIGKGNGPTNHFHNLYTYGLDLDLYNK